MAKPKLAASEPVYGWIILGLFAAALFFVPMPQWAIEQYYSRDTYPWLQNWMTTISNVLPIAVLDLLIAAVGLLVLFRVLRLVSALFTRGIIDTIWESIRRVIRGVAFVAILFMWTWGCNYRRQPLEQGLPGGTAVRPSVESLTAAVSDANALASALRPGVMAVREISFAQTAASLAEPMDQALVALNQPKLMKPGRPKFSVLLTPFFTWAGVNGMVNPFLLESIVHPDLLPFERPFVMAHEWAHLAGHADEAEASAIGWLACMRGTAPLAYSANLYLIMEAGGALPPEDRRKALAGLDAGVRTDLNAIAQRREKEDPRVQKVASRVYDEYLRANRVADGTASYSRALRLILSPPLRDALSSAHKKNQGR